MEDSVVKKSTKPVQISLFEDDSLSVSQLRSHKSIELLYRKALVAAKV